MQPGTRKEQSIPGRLDPGSHNKFNDRIFPLLVTQLYNRAIIGVIATAVNASILAIILWEQVSKPALAAWFTMIMLTTILRFRTIKDFQRSANQEKDFRRWGRKLLLHLGISGLLWGSSAFVIFPAASTAHQVFIAFVLGGMVAGAAGTFSAIISVFLSFSIPALVPIILRFFALGDTLHMAMGAMTLFFGLLMFFVASSISRSIKELIFLKETFADQLAERTAELSETQKQIKQSLKDKESLLQETHHRVKNNMHVIISLMNLQASKIKIEEQKAHFQQAVGRVTAMALVHDILYRSDSLGDIDLKEYFTRLANSLSGMYDASGVAIHVAAGNFKLNIDRAIPCGLIIHELVSNALKYAFAENRTGKIRIEVAKEPPNTLVLIVADDGAGLPDHVEISKTDTLGLKLVLGLTENQLGGKLELDRAQGTKFTIKFPLNIS